MKQLPAPVSRPGASEQPTGATPTNGSTEHLSESAARAR